MKRKQNHPLAAKFDYDYQREKRKADEFLALILRTLAPPKPATGRNDI